MALEALLTGVVSHTAQAGAVIPHQGRMLHFRRAAAADLCKRRQHSTCHDPEFYPHNSYCGNKHLAMIEATHGKRENTGPIAGIQSKIVQKHKNLQTHIHLKKIPIIRLFIL